MDIQHLTSWQAVGVAALLLALVFLLGRLSGRGGKLARPPYQRQPLLFSPDERAFFHLLKEAVGGECEIFGKIRVEDVIAPKRGASRELLAPVEERHFNFLLCDKNRLAPLCAIQLHARQAGPDPLQPICESLGLPLLRFQAGAAYSVLEVRESVRKAMARQPFCPVEADGRREPSISSIDDLPL